MVTNSCRLWQAISSSIKASAPKASVPASPLAPVEKAVEVETYTTKKSPELSKVVMIFNPAKFEDVKTAMNSIGVTGMTVTNVMGCGIQKGHIRKYRGIEIDPDTLKVVFREPSVYFEDDSYVVKPAFKELLKDFFPRYCKVLKRFDKNIQEIRIEGHASNTYKYL